MQLCAHAAAVLGATVLCAATDRTLSWITYVELLAVSDLRVVDQSQFTGEECPNIPSGTAGCPPDRLVGLEPVMQCAVQIVVDGVGKCTGEDGDYRVAPLVFSRLARGGKTTALKTLFDALKQVPVHDTVCPAPSLFSHEPKLTAFC